MVNGICNTLLDALGNTPLVRLQRMREKDAAQTVSYTHLDVYKRQIQVFIKMKTV